jgi:uncharacterized protein YggT (Ycf19 family)
MAEPYEENVVQRETVDGDPAARPVVDRPVAPRAATTRTSVSSYRSGTAGYRLQAVVWWVVGVIDTLIAIRFLLKLFGASTGAGFVQLIYQITDPLVAPFHGIFNTAAVRGSIFEPESLIAIIIYLLIGWGLVTLVRILSRPSGSTTVVP